MAQLHLYCAIRCWLMNKYIEKLSDKENVWDNTHTHTRLMALFPGLPRWAGTRKVKPIWILMNQETVSGSGISWAICKSAPRSRQITTPAPHYSVFLQSRCPSCRPTHSVKALKAWCMGQQQYNSREEKKDNGIVFMNFYQFFKTWKSL